MPSSNTYDCVIVGGGPAGAVAAYALAGYGMSVAIIEARGASARLRPKVCGGGLQIKAVRTLPFDIREVVEQEIRGMVFLCRLANRFTRRHGSPFSYTVNRARFDGLLLRHAQEVGATLLGGERVCQVEPAPKEGCVRVSTHGSTLSARIVIGADGAGSIVRRVINPKGIRWVQIGAMCELNRDESTRHIADDLFIIDWGTVPGGYAWVFPKKTTLTAGVMVPRELVSSLHTYLHVFLEREGLKMRGERVLAHPIPTRRPGEPIASDWGVLAGDAAGLTDPFTGEGLYYAIRSGQIAARHAERCLRSGGSLLDYEVEIDRTLMQEIIVAGKMRSFFNTFSSYIHNLYRKNDRLWYAFCEVMRGDRTLEGLRRVRTRPPRPILRYLERFTSWYETRQISRFQDFAAFK